MNITMIMVSTITGKITNGDNPHVSTWASAEDQKHFFSFIKNYSVIIMGSKTYDVVKNNLKLQKGKLRIILTSHPETYMSESVPDQLMFSDKSPKAIYSDLQHKGYQDILLVGGGTINTSFLQAGLVDDIYLTIEPKIFGTGKPLVNDINFTTDLQLITTKKLNDQGTLLLHYEVKK